MKVRQLTQEQKDQLIGQTYDGVQFFNPSDVIHNIFNLCCCTKFHLFLQYHFSEL